MASTNSDHCGSTCNAGSDAGRRILDDEAVFGFVAHFLGSENERVGMRLAPLELLVVGCYDNWGQLDANTRQSAMAIGGLFRMRSSEIKH
jgi:hypothetical protein